MNSFHFDFRMNKLNKLNNLNNYFTIVYFKKFTDGCAWSKLQSNHRFNHFELSHHNITSMNKRLNRNCVERPYIK